MLDFLPLKILNSLKSVDINFLSEIRIRCNYPIICNYHFKKQFLCEHGISNNHKNSLIATENDIKGIIENLTENSLYAYNDYLKNGFLTSKKGVRVGLTGTCVFEEEKIITIKDVTTLCIRIPHTVLGCSNSIFNIVKNNRTNVLIISPPGYGKTTILKDLIRNYNENTDYNLLVVNERGELNDAGMNIDLINYSNKSYAINYAIRSMSPDIIFMDELSSEDDVLGVIKAVNSGVNVIATIHSDSVENVVNKFKTLKEYFDYFVILDSKDKPGQILGIYNKKFYEI